MRLTLPPPAPSTVEVLGEGPEAAGAVVDLLQRAGGGPMILVYVETAADGVNEVSLETVTFARDLSAAGGGVPDRRGRGRTGPEGVAAELAAYGVRTVHHADGDDFDRFSGAATAAAVVAARQAAGSVVVMAGGTNRGNEVLARVATRLGVAMAANVVSFGGLSPVRRHPAGRRWRRAGGDAALAASGGVHRRRPRRRARPCGRARGRDRAAARRRARPGRPRRARGLGASATRPTTPAA